VLVEPGAPDDRYLLAKLRGEQLAVGGSGSSMPLGGTLDSSEIAKVEAWIASGAPR
jgi:hypothetical protein